MTIRLAVYIPRYLHQCHGIPYRRFTNRDIPFIPVYRATLHAAPTFAGEAEFATGPKGHKQPKGQTKAPSKILRGGWVPRSLNLALNGYFVACFVTV